MSQAKQIELLTLRGRLDFIFSILKKNRGLIAIYILIVILIAILNAAFPYFTKLQIDQLELKSNQLWGFQLEPVSILVLLLLLPAALELIRIYFFSRFEIQFSVLLDSKIRQATERLIWDKLQDLDAGFFQSQRNKKVLREALSSSYVVKRFFSFMTQRLSTLVGLITIIPLFALVSTELLILVMAASLLQFLINQQLDKNRQGYSLMERHQDDRMWRLMDALDRSFFDLKTLGATEKMIQQYTEIREEKDLVESKKYVIDQRLRTYSWLVHNSMTILTNVFVGYQVLQGNLSIGTFTLVVSYTTQISSLFSSIMSSFSEWQDISISLYKLHFLFALKSRLRFSENPVAIGSRPKKLELKDVTFVYPSHYQDERHYLEFMISKMKNWINKYGKEYYQRDVYELEKVLAEEERQTDALKNASLVIERGKVTALVGRNGSGKTTITHLLQHHYEPNEGTVLLDGKPLYSFEATALLEQFSWLKQDPFILGRHSIKENLIFGVDQMTKKQEAEVYRVLELLGLQAFITSLPKGLDTIIDEDTSLSGGQEQLLAIARSILQKRPFMILDEASSQLDAEKEFAVLNALKKVKEEAGVLFITHRMSVARKADHIYVIDRGKILEEGSHAELLANQSLYARFWQMQTVD